MTRTIAAALSTLVVGAVVPLALAAPSAGTVARAVVAGDTDGDGFGSAEPVDCAPLDPSVHPGAPDRPDLAVTDTNCDGIDGIRDGSVFVSLGGNDAATGTAENPLRTVNAAIIKATPTGKDVLVAGGTYTESLNLADDVGVYGGYAPGTWQRPPAEVTTVQGAPGALAQGDTGVVLQRLTLRGLQDGAGNSYGLRAVPSGGASQVVLEGVNVDAANAQNGVVGSTGGQGLAGTGLLGGTGGAGSCTLGLPGLPGAFGGGNGQPGSVGPVAPNQMFTVPAGPGWTRSFAGNGGVGGSGGGGRGGTGGLSDSTFGFACGGTGGVGGRGGGGGAGGGGGQSGGGSFGVYSFDSSVVAVDSALKSGNGGTGGAGGSGGNGGGGVVGAPGLPGQCTTVVFITVCGTSGEAGLTGAPGGPGGRGGGASGGPSAAVYQGGPASGFTNQTSTLTTGTGGAGGLGGGAGSGGSGLAQQVMRPAGAPTTSTYDFDGDGLNDPADDCPADPAGASGTAGCPTGPETTIASGPADGGFLLANRAAFGFGSSVPSPTFTCSLDGGDGAACTSPRALTSLTGRTHVFRVWSRDGSGTPDPSAATRAFTVPRNNTALTHSPGHWTRKTASGYFLNSYSTTTRKGASLTTRVADAQKLALVATKGPGFGKVNVMLGQTRLAQVNLAATRLQKKRLIAVPVTAPVTGTVKVVVVTAGKQVRIEGLGVATP